MARFQESIKQAGRTSMMDERERGWSMAIEEAGI
jgi:hypothetical protein